MSERQRTVTRSSLKSGVRRWRFSILARGTITLRRVVAGSAVFVGVLTLVAVA
jgi:hypothetical protein